MDRISSVLHAFACKFMLSTVVVTSMNYLLLYDDAFDGKTLLKERRNLFTGFRIKYIVGRLVRE